eukprot:scaffold560350_cov25-Prasinocladus_malaysianus.AAC.1
MFGISHGNVLIFSPPESRQVSVRQQVQLLGLALGDQLILCFARAAEAHAKDLRVLFAHRQGPTGAPTECRPARPGGLVLSIARRRQCSAV